METQGSAQTDGTAAGFLVERYLPRGQIADLAASVRRVTRACAGEDGRPTGVRYLQSIYLPGEDICFCLFQGTSSRDVRAVNAAGGFPLDRLTSAVLLIRPNPAELAPASGSSLRLPPHPESPRTPS